MPKKTFSTTKLIALGTSAIALAAGTYYFFGPEGKIHRKKAGGWMIKMKGEIIEKIEQAEEITEQAYHSIVDAVLATYITAGKIDPADLKAYAEGLKKQWKNIVKTAKGSTTKRKLITSKAKNTK